MRTAGRGLLGLGGLQWDAVKRPATMAVQRFNLRVCLTLAGLGLQRFVTWVGTRVT
jgi:hypothetical protein